MAAPVTKIFRAEELLPSAWRVEGGSCHVFNPGLVSLKDGYLFAYRVVLADGLRRIACCRLDASLAVVEGTQVPLSEHIRFEARPEYTPQTTSWFADPRLCRLGGRLVMTWNSGWHEPINQQFLVELGETDFLPKGPARELELVGERKPIEKNWTLFGDGPFHVCYSPDPLVLLDFDFEGTGPIRCKPGQRHEWGNRIYGRRYGVLRGGSHPVRRGELYFSACHSLFRSAASAEVYDYHAAFQAFSAKAPYAPVLVPHRPVVLAPDYQRQGKVLNPSVGQVRYPCGLVCLGDEWLLSFGIDDEACGITRISHTDVLGSLMPL